MKFLLPALLLLCISLSSFAQPIITAANSNPVAGDTFYARYCSATGVTTGPSGAGVTWNFGGWTPIHSDDTLDFVACSSTPYCSSFPGSTLAVPYGPDQYNYYITDADRLAFSGYRTSGVSKNFPEPMNLRMYPMSYGMAKGATHEATQPGSPIYDTGIDSLYADGYGTLILPTGTYNNVLRVHVVNYLTDSSALISPPILTHHRSEAYYWYTPGFHRELAYMYVDTNGGGTPNLMDVTYFLYTPPAAGVNDINGSNMDLTILPNPANNNIRVSLNMADGGNIVINAMDMAGRKVGDTKVQSVNAGKTAIAYDVSDLARGVYLLKVQTPSGTEIRKIQVVR